MRSVAKMDEIELDLILDEGEHGLLMMHRLVAVCDVLFECLHSMLHLTSILFCQGVSLGRHAIHFWQSPAASMTCKS